MKDIRQFFLDASYDEIKAIALKHIDFCKLNKRAAGNPKWFDESETLNLIGIDCDTDGKPDDLEIEFNLGRYKDFLIVVFNNPSGTYDLAVVEVTLDPGKDKPSRMNLLWGAYDSYSVGIHGLSSGNTETYVEGVGNVTRYCVRQDRNKVYIARTDGSGKSKVIWVGWDMPYSNIHDPNKYIDSSAGCTVTRTVLEWFKKLLPYLYDIKNKKFVPKNHKALTYLVMTHKQLEGYAGESIKKEERAEAVNDLPGEDISGEGKAATKEGTVK